MDIGQPKISVTKGPIGAELKISYGLMMNLPMRIMLAVISGPSLLRHSSLWAVDTWCTTASAPNLWSHSM